MAEIGRERCQMCSATVSGEGEAHPLYKGVNFAEDMEEKAAEWIRGINSEYIASLLAFGIEDEKVLPKCMLDKSVVKSLTSAN